MKTATKTYTYSECVSNAAKAQKEYFKLVAQNPNAALMSRADLNARMWYARAELARTRGTIIAQVI